MPPEPKSERRSAPVGKSQSRRTALIVVVAVLILAVAAGAFVYLRGAGRGFGPLTGRWLRLDGGYILEIRGVDAAGKMDAVYLNPRPINVSKAQATRDESGLKVFVELQAYGYPGSTYTLTHDPTGDQLCGVYYQAVLQQHFDVCFVRAK